MKPGKDTGIEWTGGQLKGRGPWTLQSLAALKFPAEPDNGGSAVKIDLADVSAMDTAGAWVLHREVMRLEGKGLSVEVAGLAEPLAALYERVRLSVPETPADKPHRPDSFLERLGKSTIDLWQQSIAFLAFVGHMSLTLIPLVVRPTRLRWRIILNNLQTAGADALPIVGLLALLMGVVIAYQGAIPLSQYGANLYIADLVGLAMLRELSPMITAIIVAGRTGAAYTAEIGSMKINEEVDALKVMGVPPMEILVLPKLIALLIALPLLTVFSDILGVAGGMLMADAVLDVSPSAFIEEFLIAVDLEAFLVGIGKAPVFAAIIVAVGCFQGFQAQGSAESVGRRTTASVVQSIFLVIVIDAAFSVAFSALGI